MTALKVHAFKLNIGLFRRLSLLFVLMILAIGLCPAAYALTPLDPYAGAELSVTFAYSGTPLPGARFSLYRVGDVDADAGITLLAPFSETFTIKDARSTSQWDQLAGNMAKLCKEKAVEPLTTGTTDQSGRVRFGDGRSLSCGLYLVVGEDLVYRDAKYTSLPFLVLLPSWNTESAVWEYAVRAAPKLGREALPPKPTVTPTPTPGVTPTPAPTISPVLSSTPKISVPPNPFAKALTLFSQLRGSFSSSFSFLSYSVVSPINCVIFTGTPLSSGVNNMMVWSYYTTIYLHLQVVNYADMIASKI